MFSLSTSWNHTNHTTGKGIITEIRAAGFDTAELNFALTRPIVEEIIALKDAGIIRISSLHNMCPLPDEIAPGKASPDYYSLAALTDAERGRAVAVAKETIACAARCGARAVVLHAGRVEMKDRTRELAALVGDARRAAAFRDEMKEERSTKSEAHLAAAITSIGELIPFAAEKGIALGIENRYYYREIPLIDEIDHILHHFRRANVYYWHDTGHAEAFERLGLVRHRDLLERFSNRLLGLHLHDIIGPMGDHHAPGCGTFDFRMLAPYITRDTITVIEAHQPATADDLRRSALYLAGVFGNRL
jgi:sugar phosphate isomerase/epimerase